MHEKKSSCGSHSVVKPQGGVRTGAKSATLEPSGCCEWQRVGRLSSALEDSFDGEQFASQCIQTYHDRWIFQYFLNLRLFREVKLQALTLARLKFAVASAFRAAFKHKFAQKLHVSCGRRIILIWANQLLFYMRLDMFTIFSPDSIRSGCWGWYPDEDEFTLIDFGRDRIGGAGFFSRESQCKAAMPCIILYQDMIWLHSRSEPAAPAGEVSKLLLDPTGFHALMTNSSGDTWYLNFQSGSACKGLKLLQLWFCIVLCMHV